MTPEKTGGKFETQVDAALIAANVHRVPKYRTGICDLFNTEIVPDFFIPQCEWTDGFYIECKYLNSEGSVIDKLAHTKDRAALLNRPLLILSCGCRSEEIIQFIHAHRSRGAKNLMCPMNMDAFTAFLIERCDTAAFKKPEHDSRQTFLL